MAGTAMTWGRIKLLVETGTGVTDDTVIDYLDWSSGYGDRNDAIVHVNSDGELSVS